MTISSVILPTKNRVSMLVEAASSLATCDPAPGELVVVDDGSDQPVEGALRSLDLPFRLRVLRNERSIGPAAARNRGVHASRGAILLFTDDDCVVAPGWVGALCGHLAQADAALGGVGGRVLARDRDVFSRYFEFHRILEPRPHDARNPRRIPYLVTANCAIHREAFMRAGGFDTRILIAGGDDVALSVRIVKQGFHLEHAPDAVVHHRFRPGLREFARTFYRYGLGGRYVVDRYLPL